MPGRKAFSEVLAGMLVAAAPAQSAERTFEMAQHLDCRYSTATPATQVSAEDTPSPLEGVLLPDNDVFRPLLADQREPRFYADYRRIHFNSSSAAATASKSACSAWPFRSSTSTLLSWTSSTPTTWWGRRSLSDADAGRDERASITRAVTSV